jgi:hypothetical protein
MPENGRAACKFVLLTVTPREARGDYGFGLN